MKKLAIALSAALIMALAVPAFAASTLQLGGQLGTDFTYGKDANGKYGLTGKSWLDVSLGAEAQGGTQIKGVITLTPWEIKSGLETDADGNYIRTPFEILTPISGTMPFGVDKAYLQSVGPFWTGGPSMATTAGDVTVQKDKYVAWLGDRKGITVDGFKLGPLSADAFYVWPVMGPKVDGNGNVVNDPATNQPIIEQKHSTVAGISTAADISGIHVGGIVVNHDNGVDFATNASADVIPGVKVSGMFAADREFASDMAHNYAYRVDGSFSPLSWLTLKAGYRADNAFNPEYIATDSDNAPQLGTGFSAGADAMVQGVHMAAGYDQPTDAATASADTTLAGVKLAGDVEVLAQQQQFSVAHMSAERSIALAGLPAINGKYQATIAALQDGQGKYTGAIDVTHELSADTTLNFIPQLQNVTISGDVQVKNNKLADASIGAKYVAPNGINLGASYGMVSGPQVTAGMQAEF